MSKKLPHTSENVCLTVDDDSVMYAVGSKANTDLLDARTLQVRTLISTLNVLTFKQTHPIGFGMQ